VPDMPLVYSGMEGGLNKRLLFFEKDPIQWKENEYRSIYTKLFKLKKENKALWNGPFGGEIIKIELGDSSIFAFSRQKDNNKVIAFFNLSNMKKTVRIDNDNLKGNYIDLWSGKDVTINGIYSITLEPFANSIFYR
jgi:glycosidase